MHSKGHMPVHYATIHFFLFPILFCIDCQEHFWHFDTKWEAFNIWHTSLICAIVQIVFYCDKKWEETMVSWCFTWTRTHTCVRFQTHTELAHEEGKQLRGRCQGKPSICVSKAEGGGSNLIPCSVQLKHALMPPLLLLQDILSLSFSLTLDAYEFFLCLCVRASQRSSEEARGGGRPQERAPQEN